MIDWSSDLYTSEVCWVLPTCNAIFCSHLLHQFRRCKRRKHQIKLVLACSYRKQEVTRLNSSPWGQHLIHPICPWVCASRTKHKAEKRQERAVVKDDCGKCHDQWGVLACYGALSSEDHDIHTHGFFGFFQLWQDKEAFSFIKSWFASSFKFDITDRDNLKSSSSRLLCNHTVVTGCCKNGKFFIF